MSTVKVVKVYSLQDDFGGTIKVGQLHDEVEGNALITTTFEGIFVTNEGNVEIRFATPFSNEEESMLNTLVENHIPNFAKDRINNIPVYPSRTTTDSTEWIRLGLTEFPGTKRIGAIDYIDVISRMESSIDSYKIKVIDRSNAKELCQGNLTNIVLEQTSLGFISNAPETATTLEFIGKVDGGTGDITDKFHVDKFLIYHGN